MLHNYPFRAKARRLITFGTCVVATPGQIVGYYRDSTAAAEHAGQKDYLLEREVSLNNWEKVDSTLLGAQS